MAGDFVNRLSDEERIELETASGQSFIQKTENLLNLFPDEFFADFFRQVFINEKKLDISVGFPRKDFKHPSIFVSCQSINLEPTIGNVIGTSTDKNFTITPVEENGLITGRKTNIKAVDSPYKSLGQYATGGVSVKCYADNWDAVKILSSRVYSTILHNVPYYLTDTNDYAKNLDRDVNIRPIEVRPLSIFVQMHDDLVEGKHIWSVTISLNVRYILEVKQIYNYITDICATEYINDPITGETIQVNQVEVFDNGGE